MDLFSTIAAISTPPGSGGISIIRISGPDAVKIGDSVFEASSRKKISECPSHTIHHGHIVSHEGKKLDEVLVSLMKAPRTFTGEDTVEINCHGGLLVTKAILAEVLRAGAVSAGKGEFTKRAFLNGKLDLCEAESVIDIINSKTSLEQEISVNNLGGALSDKINALRERIITLSANIQVLIDYPDEGLEPFGDDEFAEELGNIHSELYRLIATSDSGMLIRSGIPTAIAGKPNVGKSSLMNLLSGQQKAIVTDIEGTTRDVIEEYVNIGNITLRLSDTAGIRDTEDVVEKIGVQRSLECIESSELVIFVADAASGLDQSDFDIINATEGKKKLALINKCDKGSLISKTDLSPYFDNVIDFSVKTEQGLAELENVITNLFELGEVMTNASSVITNARHKDALIKADEAIKSARDTQNAGIPIDTTFIDLEAAASALGEIVGLTVSEEIVDKIFHKFCIGK